MVCDEAIPYINHNVRVQHAYGRQSDRRAAVSRPPVDPFGWLTDGKLRPIEQGFRIMDPSGTACQHETEVSKSRLDVLRGEINWMIGNIDEYREWQDPPDPPPPVPPPVLRTGITTVPLRKMPGQDMIDCVGKFHVESVGTVTAQGETSFPKRYEFSHHARRPPVEEELSKAGTISRASALHEQLDSLAVRKVVSAEPEKFPWDPEDFARDYPDDHPWASPIPSRYQTTLRRGSTSEQRPSMPRPVNFTMTMRTPIMPYVSPVLDVELPSPPPTFDIPSSPTAVEEIPHERLLLDPHEHEIMWSANKAPFRRDEVAVLNAWRERGDAIYQKIVAAKGEALAARMRARREAFHSDRAFEKAGALVRRESKTIVDTGHGSWRAPSSMWEIAAKEIDKDTRSFQYRRGRWNKFRQEVREQLGGFHTRQQRQLAEVLRTELKGGAAADIKLYARLITLVSDEEITNPGFTSVWNILGQVLGVSEADRIRILEKRGIDPIVLKLELDGEKQLASYKRPPKVKKPVRVATPEEGAELNQLIDKLKGRIS